MPAITASSTRACRFDPTSRPYMTTNANGMIRIAQSSMKSVTGVGFSNGCAELVLKKPPPLVPSCLMAIWLATGPPGIDWLASAATAGSTGVAAV